MDLLKNTLILNEGMELMPYEDTTGNLTIGVGRNLSTEGIGRDEALLMLDNDLKRCNIECLQYAWFKNLDSVRREVIIELVFNMGLTRFLGFKKMIEALKIFDYEQACHELLDSLWAAQVGPRRSKNIANRLLTGSYKTN